MPRRNQHQIHQLDLLRREWAAIARSASSREAARHLRAAHPEVERLRPVDLGEVLALLEPSGGLTQVGRAELAACLLASAPDHPMIARALLQTLVPGIVSVARRLRWGEPSGDDPASFLADLITAAYELIVEWGGQRRPYAAPDLLNALRCRMRRRIGTQRRIPTDPLERADGTTVEIPISSDPSAIDQLEAEIAARAVDDPVGAAGLLGRAVLGLSYREISVQTGLPARQIATASRDMARRILG